jgi:hypothetical protein
LLHEIDRRGRYLTFTRGASAERRRAEVARRQLASFGARLDLYFAVTSQSGTWPVAEIAGWPRDAGLTLKKPIHLRTVPGAVEVVAVRNT